MATLSIVMGQINPIVGDIEGNAQRMIEAALSAQSAYHADIIVFPELALSGYPPEDLLLRSELYDRIARAKRQLAQMLPNMVVVMGHPDYRDHHYYNAASVCIAGQWIVTYDKQYLPNYAVFDEKRYFSAGNEAVVFVYQGVTFGLTICEDIWHPEPAAEAAAKGATILLNLNASPYQEDKQTQRETIIRQRVKETGCTIISVNMVGGQDELVFDGTSFAISAQQDIVAKANCFTSELHPIAIETQDQCWQYHSEVIMPPSRLALTYQALVVGIRDYLRKNGFRQVVLGLSGGIDSALTLALAIDAVGSENVTTLMMPSQYTAKMSIDDAKTMAETCRVAHHVVPITAVFEQFNTMLQPILPACGHNLTEQNIQARSRGLCLMAWSNQTGALLLSTGNKSELAVGYATLYGDMAGGFAPLKDVYKTMVYQLARYRNQQSEIIPERIITRAPSAELAADQLDQDTLPPYEQLDAILTQYLAEEASIKQIAEMGIAYSLVEKVIKMVDSNEYKRRQASPGVIVSNRAFGRDRRYPITSKF